MCRRSAWLNGGLLEQIRGGVIQFSIPDMDEGSLTALGVLGPHPAYSFLRPHGEAS